MRTILRKIYAIKKIRIEHLVFWSFFCFFGHKVIRRQCADLHGDSMEDPRVSSRLLADVD